MDTIELRAAAAKLEKLHERFIPCFGRCESREHSLGYVKGLLLAEGRKSIEPMALVFGGPSPDPAGIFPHGHVPHPMQAVLDPPMVPRKAQQRVRVCL